MTKIRTGDFAGKDRVVFELAGRGTPRYSVNYVDAPTQQGSGFPIEVGGDSFLEVTLLDQILPTETDLAGLPVGTVATTAAPGVAGVVFASLFEGQAQSVIGLKGTGRTFTTFVLAHPARVVVDISR